LGYGGRCCEWRWGPGQSELGLCWHFCEAAVDNEQTQFVQFLRPFAVILNGLNFSGGFHTFDSVDENPGKYGIFFASSVEVAGWLLTSDNSNLFDFVVGPFVPENGGGHTGLGSSGGLHHGSGGESLGFLFVECGCDGVKITTLVILTKVENAKVLTKTFYKTFLLSFFLFSVLTKTFHPNRCHH